MVRCSRQEMMAAEAAAAATTTKTEAESKIEERAKAE